MALDACRAVVCARRGRALGWALALVLAPVTARVAVSGPDEPPPAEPRGAGARPAPPPLDDDPDPEAPRDPRRAQPFGRPVFPEGAGARPPSGPTAGDPDPTAPGAPDPARRLEGTTPFGPEQRMRLRTDPVVGRVRYYEVPDPRRGPDAKAGIVVLAGNPHLSGDDYAVKAATIVLWLDAEAESELGAFFGGMLPTGGAGATAKGGDARPGATPRSPPASPAATSVIPASILAIYAEGAVEFTAGLHVFRAMQLVYEPRTGRMLVVEPRYDGGVTAGQGTDERLVPVFVRAQRARGLADGFLAFDAGEVTTSRANDRVAMNVQTLTIEEYGQAVADEPVVLGFSRPGTQRFEATGIRVQAERVPLLYVPHAAFGGAAALTELPVRIRRTSTGSRSSLGRYAFFGVGGEGEPWPWLDWTLDVGGYSSRGPAFGTDVLWKAPQGKDAPAFPRAEGRWRTLSVYDTTGDDRTGFDAGRGYRGLSYLEHRWEPASAWRFDVEANVFSDRGVHREYDEDDLRTHKDRETYGRVRWQEGGTTATATAGLRVRDFVTESFAQPEVAVSSESIPLGQLPGLPPLDLSSEVRAGRWVRRFDEDLATDGYEAWRLDVLERLHFPFDVGDLRVSPFVGGRWTAYTDRSDGGDDVHRGAMEAGVRGNLQFWRDFGVYGGPWNLDGLRHVVDVDVGGYARFLDAVDPEDVPYFDRIDGERDRTELFVEVRSRVVTRRAVRLGERALSRQNVTLLDARVRAAFWPDEVGPYGRRGPGELEGWLTAELAPRTAWLEGSILGDFDGPALRRAALGAHWAPSDDFFVAGGVRYVRDALLGPWIDAYWRWNEKWALRVSAVEDFERRGDGSLRLTLVRFSPDHYFELGPVLRDNGRDVGFYFNVMPALGGQPVRGPFLPRETFGLGAEPPVLR